MIFKYKRFLDDKLFENLINESVIYFSPDFRKSLNRINSNQIAKDLLEIEAENIKPDITFIDKDKEGYLSFSTMKNAWKKIEPGYPHLDYISKTERSKEDRIRLANDIIDHHSLSKVYSTSRNQIKLGKFVNRILPGKYTASDIEKFTNEFKGSEELATERFELVEGDDIAKWYKGDNYKEIKGQLGNSCMRNNRSDTFEIYTKNKQVCRMLILREDDKILGRSLIWKLDSSEEIYFMDRQYTIKDSDVIKFRRYAIDNGWIYKENNTHTSLSKVSKGEDPYNYDMRVQLSKTSIHYHYDNYPYMDTFRRYNPMTGLMYNDEEEGEETAGHYILDDTSGDYREAQEGVWSDWHDCYIDEDEAVYSEGYDTMIRRDYATHITNSDHYNGWYPDDCDDIVYDDQAEEYFHIDDTSYSSRYMHHVSDKDIIKVIDEINKDGDPEISDDVFSKHDEDVIKSNRYENSNWFERLSDRNEKWIKADGILDELFVTDYNNKFILEQYKIEEFGILGPNKNNKKEIRRSVTHLSKLDADLLGYDLEVEKRLVDKFTYYNEKSEELDNIYKIAISRFEKSKRTLDKQKINQDSNISQSNIDLNNLSLQNQIEELKIKIDDISGNLFTSK